MHTDQRQTGELPKRSVAGNVIRGSLGNLIEWYDWYAYAAFSIYFAGVFFPSGDLTAQLLNTAGIFAVGFLVRPIGGWMFGRYADRFGRRAALTLSVSLMGVGSLGIAMLPGYAQIGALAPILLVAARLLQGLSLGGEYGTSATYFSEVATPHRRGFYSSFQYVTLTSGQLLALGVQIVLQQVLTSEQMHAWGWRIAFVIGAAAAVTVMWLRRTMDESENFALAVKESADTERGSLRALLSYPRECLTVVGLTLGGTIAFYTFTTYMQKFMINTAGLPKEQVTWINFVALLIFVVHPAGDRCAVGSDRPPTAADRVRDRRNAVHRSAAHRGVADRLRTVRVRPDDDRPDHRVGLHIDQCCGEGRAVPRPDPSSRCRAALRADGRDLRRHHRVRRAGAEEHRSRELVLLLRRRLRADLATGLRLHGRVFRRSQLEREAAELRKRRARARQSR